MIIDYTYFFGKLKLPQTGNTEGREEIDEYISIYETEFLQKVLGYDLWSAFSEGIEGSGDPDQRWQDLLDGIVFEYKDVYNLWNGFDPESKKTPIANYVYYKYLENTASDVTLAGTSTGAVDNNTRISPMSKMIAAWNDMTDMIIILKKFLTNNSDYPEYDKRQIDGELFRHKNSLDL